MPAGDLAALGRIWGIVRYAHPWIGYRDVDLDAATLKAIARVRQGGSAGAAVDEMLAPLGDPATFATRQCWDSPGATVDRASRVLADGAVYVSTSDAQARTLLTSARTAIIDLRPQPGRCAAPSLAPELVPLLVRGTLPLVRHRKVRHYGYRSQTASDPQFDSSFATIDPGSIAGTSPSMARVVFIVDARSAIPPVATALSAEGQATFVSVGRFPLHTAVDHCQMALGDGTIVTLRTSELVDTHGYAAEPAPMIELAADATEADVVAAAQQLAKPRGGRRRASGISTSPLPPFAWKADEAYATDGLPSAEERILAGYRLWNVVSFFHGSREMLAGWDVSLREVVTMLEHATTRAQYELALAEVLAIVPDGASRVDAPAVIALRGAAAPPFELMPVEGKPVVTASRTEPVTRDRSYFRCRSISGSVPLPIEPKPTMTIGPVMVA